MTPPPTRSLTLKEAEEILHRTPGEHWAVVKKTLIDDAVAYLNVAYGVGTEELMEFSSTISCLPTFEILALQTDSNHLRKGSYMLWSIEPVGIAYREADRGFDWEAFPQPRQRS